MLLKSVIANNPYAGSSVKIIAQWQRRAAFLAFTILCGYAQLSTAQIPTVPRLNDTGIDKCYNNTAEVPCATVAADVGTHPRQDGRYGRDKKPGLPKVGGGNKGFDYTRVCNSGQLAGTGACPATPVFGAGVNEWGCTKDNVTNLIWEVKTTSGLRAVNHTYSWYSTDSSSNGGDAGSVGGNTCGSTLVLNQCNTYTYALTVNAAKLCGAADWRVPNLLELNSLVDYGASIVAPVDAALAIDSTYFPNTRRSFYWSSSSYARVPYGVKSVSFNIGSAENRAGHLKDDTLSLRLVRGGQ